MPQARKRRGSQSTDGRNDSEDNCSLSSGPVTKRQRTAISEPVSGIFGTCLVAENGGMQALIFEW
jgi:hypothetical protein